jgi:hypothetical protein
MHSLFKKNEIFLSTANQFPHLIKSLVTYTEKRDMQTKQEKEKKNKHHLRIEKKPPTKKNKNKSMHGHQDHKI